MTRKIPVGPIGEEELMPARDQDTASYQANAKCPNCGVERVVHIPRGTSRSQFSMPECPNCGIARLQ